MVVRVVAADLTQLLQTGLGLRSLLIDSVCLALNAGTLPLHVSVRLDKPFYVRCEQDNESGKRYFLISRQERPSSSSRLSAVCHPGGVGISGGAAKGSPSAIVKQMKFVFSLAANRMRCSLVPCVCVCTSSDVQLVNVDSTLPRLALRA